MNEGIEAMASGNLDRAENLFTKLIEANPSFTEAWNKRATLRFMLWDFEGSLKDVEKVLKVMVNGVEQMLSNTGLKNVM